MLLRFRTANHGSIRDPAELSMVAAPTRGATPPRGDWGAATLRVAGIYGANASGKSTVIAALGFFVSVVRNSATVWAERERLPHLRFLLDEAYATEASLYELDLALDSVRYTYSFRLLPTGITEEWLYSYPAGRRRLLFERTGSEFEFGRHLAGDNVRISRVTRPTALFLSTEANNGHRLLGDIHDWISRHMKFARPDEPDRLARLRWIMRLAGDEEARQTADALLRFADFGVSGLEVHEDPIPNDLRTALRTFLETVSFRNSTEKPDGEIDKALTEKTADGVTELFSAAEFSVRARDNLERRYLHGRYGAIPILSRAELHQAISRTERIAS